MPDSENIQAKLVDIWRERPKIADRDTKFGGDVCCRIVKKFLEAEICPKFRVTEPNSYIRGARTEFDLLVIQRKAQAIRYTCAFCPQDVLCAVEVKARAPGFGAKKGLGKEFARLRERFAAAKREFRHLALVMFIFEAQTPKSKSAINYLDRTKKAMKPFPVFCMAKRTGELMEGQWQEFVQYVRKCCERRRA